MTNTGWRVALGTTASSAFFWGVAGAVDMGMVRVRKGYTLPEGGGWYTLAVFAGFIVAYFSVCSLTDRLAGWKMALIPAAGAGVGAASVLLMGQQDRHWIAAFALVLAGSAAPLVVRRLDRARRPRQDTGPTT